MKHWTRATVPQRCGLCGAVIRAGEAVAVYDGTVGPRRRPLRLLRCGPCEGGAPPDLPAVIAREEPPRAPVTWSRLGLLPLDFKARAIVENDREPGEDG